MKHVSLSLALLLAPALCAQPALLASAPAPDDFPLVRDGRAASFALEASIDPAVTRAVEDVRSDIESVSGIKPAMEHSIPVASRGSLVLVGIVGQSAWLAQLGTAGRLELHALAGAWESFAIAVVPQPFPGVDQALVIAGSDRRGAIYGLYELSAAIGVSPWHWWDDLPPTKKSALSIAAGTHRFGPPSVKYRGLFLNDEDWGLQPWAAHTFEPASGGIGPKTYAKVFELLLRLKANTLWPAMHPGTKAFNAFPENKQLADRYGIVMGSSHAEPMLRNNVGEWTAPSADYNYPTNRSGVLRYWEQRVAENGRYENIYTLGMRGIHDSEMQGPKTDAERIRTIEQIFADQRALLARHVRSDVARVPQMFCAYKEVLDLYRQGLRVPDDVTIVWPDDNFGYIRNFATASERARRGGFGVYYHLSYLGRPLSYLWLCTTPPALIWEEMRKAYDHGADRIWIANVGDLKPAEIPAEFFLQMAWDIDRWRGDTLPGYLRDWATRSFGPENATGIAAALDDYYRFNFQRKPEHLQWWLPGQVPQPSTLTDAEVRARLDAFAGLHQRVDALRDRIPPDRRDAFYELVAYPMIGAALANERFFEGERGNLAAAEAADARLATKTSYFNKELAGGKWRGLMSLEPADAQWSSMRLARWTPPARARTPVPSPAAGTFISLNASRFSAQSPRKGAAWTLIPGLGRTGEAVTVLPSTFASVELADAARKAPRLDYAVEFPAAGSFTLYAHLLPTHPIAGAALRLAVALEDDAPQLVKLDVGDGEPAWAQGVLDGIRLATTQLTVNSPGTRTLRIYGLDPGVVLDKLVIDLGGLTPSYLGPPSAKP
jgi:hypothetical protein